MKQKIGALFFLVSVLSLCFLTGCQCSHEWAEASCTEPKICTKCEEVEGEALGHEWLDADCTTPKTCNVCGETEGEPAGHDYDDATCTEKEICKVCGDETGEALGHSFLEATCTEPQICEVCDVEEGEPLGHTVESWTTVTESTCTIPGTQTGACTVCSEEVSEEMVLDEHQAGEWEVTREATDSSDGERAKKCVNCGEILETETFTMTPAEIKQQYISKCTTYTYNEIARNPDDYLGEYASIKGEVIQVMEDGDEYTLRVNITQGSYFWSDAIMVSYTKQSSDEARILEDDIVMMYGMLAGTYTYETVLGAELTVPLMFAEYIDIL